MENSSSDGKPAARGASEWMVVALNHAREESSEPQLDAKSKVTNQLIDFQ